MNFFCLYMIITWHIFVCFGNESLSVLKSSGICIDDACLKNETVSSVDSFTSTESSDKTQDTQTELLKSTVTQELPTIAPVQNVSDKNPPPKSTLPPSIGAPFLNFTKDSKICFCDLTLNQCDINCCCDKDCALEHYKVFTKCLDATKVYNAQNCYNSKFLFRNNTSHEIIQDQGGLFCIVRDNSQLKQNYKTRPIITSLEAFNKSLAKKFYSFSVKNFKMTKFTKNLYKTGLPVWIIHDKEIKQFGIPAATVGLSCASETNIKYLIDQVMKCFYKVPESELECESWKNKNLLGFLDEIRIVSDPSLFNESEKHDLGKICQKSNCIEITAYICQSNTSCIQAPKKTSNFSKLGCYNTIPKIQYHVWHNGSEGIKKFEAFVWMNKSSDHKYILQTTEIKYSWIGTPEKVFKRSGNPGYLAGKPIMAGRKVYQAINGTTDKKEAIELSFDPKDWLTVVGSEKGICSSKTRIPINFKENSMYTCSLPLTQESFGKDECLRLQKRIFKLFMGNDVINATADSPYSKVVATFGNSKVEETGDWVQVLIDLYPMISSQIGFKRGYNSLMCKNIITDLYADIAYADFGSFVNPQSKILGVSFYFGKHKDLVFYDNLRNESSKSVQYFKLSSAVHFIDLTEPASDAFAEPLGLEVKLPHDFFYPFFSRSSNSHFPSTCLIVLVYVTCVLF